MEFNFNYLATFLSLFYGLAIMHALTCISSYIANYKKITSYFVWWIWAIYLIIISCALWMSLFQSWGSVTPWERHYTVYLTIHSSIIYLIFSVYFDDFNALGNISLEDRFYKNKKPFFILLSVALTGKIFGKLMIGGHINEYFNIIQIVCFVILSLSDNKTMHLFLGCASFIVLIMSVFKV